MTVPAKHKAKSASRRHKAHQALRKQNLAKCPQCGSAILQHTACLNCGYYKGKEVVKIKLKSEKKK